jgi:flagellar basal-body rod protein FlgB
LECPGYILRTGYSVSWHVLDEGDDILVISGMLEQNDALGSAMRAAALRGEVITGNIANNDTPGYKKKTVRFEEFLSGALESDRSALRKALVGAEPSVGEYSAPFSYRLDGNSVDIEMEMTALYSNSMKYDTLASAVISNYKALNLAITGIK